jgi:hypothetical protein
MAISVSADVARNVEGVRTATKRSLKRKGTFR